MSRKGVKGALGPSLAWRRRTWCWLMAVHLVMFPPCGPGMFTMARWPITVCPLLSARLKPASSINMETQQHPAQRLSETDNMRNSQIVKHNILDSSSVMCLEC